MPLAFIHFIHEGQHPVDPGWSGGIGLPGGPPYPSQGPGFPTHPIAPGGQPPYPSQGPGFPTHPIAGLPGGGGGQPPYPSQGPGFPTQPIYLPSPPGSTEPPHIAQLPVFPPEMTHPIVLPPNVAPPQIEGRPIEWKAAWSQHTGWVVVGIPQGEHVTPSAQHPQQPPSTPRR